MVLSDISSQGPWWSNWFTSGALNLEAETIWPTFCRTFSNAFFPMKIIVFWYIFHCILMAPIGNKSALVQIMVGAEHPTNHHLNQGWWSSMTNICITWPRWVNAMRNDALQILVLSFCLLNIYGSPKWFWKIWNYVIQMLYHPTLPSYLTRDSVTLS